MKLDEEKEKKGKQMDGFRAFSELSYLVVLGQNLSKVIRWYVAS